MFCLHVFYNARQSKKAKDNNRSFKIFVWVNYTPSSSELTIGCVIYAAAALESLSEECDICKLYVFLTAPKSLGSRHFFFGVFFSNFTLDSRCCLFPQTTTIFTVTTDTRGNLVNVFPKNKIRSRTFRSRS